MIVYACEGTTWGPHRRAASLADVVDVAMGMGKATPALEGVRWRSVNLWCSGDHLRGASMVIGDPSAATLAPAGAKVVAVWMPGQGRKPCCPRVVAHEPDAWWNVEERPLHPWAGRTDLATRGEVRARWEAHGPQVVCLSPSWAPRLLADVARKAAHPGVTVRATTNACDLIGADLAVVAAGWSTVAEVRACGVPYLAVDLGAADHRYRANAQPRDVLTGVAVLRACADLDDDARPVMPDHRAEFRDLLWAVA